MTEFVDTFVDGRLFTVADIKEILGKFVAGPNCCMIYTGWKQSAKYGYVRKQGKVILIHRIIHTVFNGPIPDGYFVLHKCDNPPCAAPNHTFAGTSKDNTSDMIAKGRHKYAITETVKASVLKLRKEGLSQDAIAKKLNLSQASVSRILRNVNEE